jgi:hypothetical protein
MKVGKTTKKRCAALYALAVAAYLLSRENEVVLKRRWWVRPWLLRREKGNLHLVNQEFKEDQDQFKTFLRMDERCFELLLNLIEARIAKQDTLKRHAISARDKLIITLRFLATCETYRSLMYSFRVAESTISLFISVVCRTIYEALVDKYMKVNLFCNIYLILVLF